MRLKKLKLNQFKNYEEVTIDLSGNLHCFYGNNGAGKTNILDAVHYLSFTKSYFGGSDQLSIRFGCDFFSVNGEFEMPLNLNEKVSVSVKSGGEKKVKRNDKEYNRFSEHIGAFPVVMITPGDIDLINNAADVRRRFFDAVISQFDKTYLDDIIRYNKVLSQRNKSLKDMKEFRRGNYADLEMWNVQIIEYAQRIYEARRKYQMDIQNHFVNMHEKLTTSDDIAEIIYESVLNSDDIKQVLEENFQNDLSAGFTTQGIHRDDYAFMINKNPARRFGSQGQQKSFLLALKLAQFLITVEKTSITPILLFDDIFDKLDPKRVKLMINLVCNKPFGQVFITDTHKLRMEDIIGKETNIQLFEVANGTVKENGLA